MIACATPAAEQRGQEAPPDGPPILAHLGVEMEGFTFEKWQEYPTAELGYSMRYGQETEHFDLYVYPVPHEVRALSDLDRIKRETDRTFGEVRAAVRDGVYTDVKLKGCRYDDEPQKTFVMICVMDLKAEGAELFSFLAIAEVDKHYLKMRATRARGNPDLAPWEKSFARFVREARAHPEALVFGKQDESIEL